MVRLSSDTGGIRAESDGGQSKEKFAALTSTKCEGGFGDKSVRRKIRCEKKENSPLEKIPISSLVDTHF